MPENEAIRVVFQNVHKLAKFTLFLSLPTLWTAIPLLGGRTLVAIRRFVLLVTSFVFSLTVTEAATLFPRDFSKSGTRFELDRYFEGHCRSWGVFENTDGSPRRTFTCDSQGMRDQAGDLILTQHFNFSDHKKLVRVWNIHRVDSTHWKATANDMIGIAEGEGQGNALYWEYTITLNRKNPLATVHVRQWMFQPEGTTDLMTRLVVTKLGIPVLEVSEVIHRVTNK